MQKNKFKSNNIILIPLTPAHLPQRERGLTKLQGKRGLETFKNKELETFKRKVVMVSHQ